MTPPRFVVSRFVCPAWPALAQLALVVVALGVVGCDAKLSPLEAPLPADRTVNAASWIVLTNADLQHLPAAVRLSAGKAAEASLAPVSLGDAKVAATTIALAIGEGAATITKDQDIALVFPVTTPVVPLALVQTGRAACALAWQAKSATLTLTLRFGRSTSGAVDVVLANEPTLAVGDDALVDASGCLSGTGDALTLSQQIVAAAASALTTDYVKAARATLQTVIPPSLEFAASFATVLQGAPITGGVQTRYRPVADGPNPSSLLHHNGSFAAIGIDVSFDVSRHPCAMDGQPPQIGVQSLPVKAPEVAASGQVLRRAVVLDRAILGHLAWAAARSGHLCRGLSRGIEKLLPANWANNAVPALGALVEAGAVGATFWPGTTPSVRVIDLDGGGGVEWQLPEAVLEMSAPVAGVELVVLRVEGTFRLVLKPQTASGIGFSVVAATVDAAVLSSPVLPKADVAAGPGLSLAVDAALKGIFAGALGFSGGTPKDGAVVVGTSRVADQLWLWLEGGALPTLPSQ